MGGISLASYAQELRALHVIWVCQRELVQNKVSAPKSEMTPLSALISWKLPRVSAVQVALVKAASFVLKHYICLFHQ